MLPSQRCLLGALWPAATHAAQADPMLSRAGTQALVSTLSTVLLGYADNCAAARAACVSLAELVQPCNPRTLLEAVFTASTHHVAAAGRVVPQAGYCAALALISAAVASCGDVRGWMDDLVARFADCREVLQLVTGDAGGAVVDDVAAVDCLAQQLLVLGVVLGASGGAVISAGATAAADAMGATRDILQTLARCASALLNAVVRAAARPSCSRRQMAAFVRLTRVLHGLGAVPAVKDAMGPEFVQALVEAMFTAPPRLRIIPLIKAFTSAHAANQAVLGEGLLTSLDAAAAEVVAAGGTSHMMLSPVARKLLHVCARATQRAYVVAHVPLGHAFDARVAKESPVDAFMKQVNGWGWSETDDSGLTITDGLHVAVRSKTHGLGYVHCERGWLVLLWRGVSGSESHPQLLCMHVCVVWCASWLVCRPV